MQNTTESNTKTDKISKKQLDIIKNMLAWEINLPEFEENVKESEKSFYVLLIEEAKQKWNEILMKNMTEEEQREMIRLLGQSVKNLKRE